MSRNVVMAGGTHGIGRALVDRLASQVDHIHLYSREDAPQPLPANVTHHVCDFTAADVDLEALPEEIQGAVYCRGSINLRSFGGLKLDDFQKTGT